MVQKQKNLKLEAEYIDLQKELRLMIVWLMNKLEIGQFTIKREELIEFLRQDDFIELMKNPRGDRIISIKDWAYKKKLEEIILFPHPKKEEER